MLAARTPILGITIAMLVLLAENLGVVAYVAHARAIDAPTEVRRVIEKRGIEQHRARIDLRQRGCHQR